MANSELARLAAGNAVICSLLVVDEANAPDCPPPAMFSSLL